MLSKDGGTLDYYGAALLVVLGAVIVWMGLDYEVGSLSRMGSGFMPVVYGMLMAAVGLCIAGTAYLSKTPAEATDGHEAGPFELRGWGCIIGGVVAFVVLGHYGGLVPATFAAVFVSALGDRENTPLSAGVLAAGLTAFGVLVFHFGLKLQLPLFTWG